ncbi:MAG: 16S rRNA (guanine(527)-N(7))-methyltransferase RsmG [Acidobacteriota bacterium]
MSESDEFARLLNRHFSSFRPLSPLQTAELYKHYQLLCRWNKSLNLTTITGLEESVVRHYCESLFLTIYLPEEAVSVLDVGSGGGFPGIPLAILRPDCAVALADSHQRKAVFLREATRHLRNVRVEPRRAEVLDTGTYDWVVSRAVKPSEVVKLAPKRVSLLLGEEDAIGIASMAGFEWQPLVSLPWGKRRVLLRGQRAS